MDYGRFFSADVPAFMPSPTRELFKKVDISSIYSLAGGYPSPDAFPLEDMQFLCGEVLRKYGAKAMQYGGSQGVPELLELISARSGEPLECLQVTTSSQQGIDVLARVLLDPGDVVLVDTPTYLGAIQSFNDYRAEIKTIPEASLRHAKFCYVIPDFGNPSGKTMTAEERLALVELARKEDFLIVEDTPYRELRYEGSAVPTIRSLAPERTVQLCSFSKIFAPGFRLGWMAGPPEIIREVYVCKQALDLCPPVFDQYLAAEFLGSGRLDRQLEANIGMYRRGRDIMLSALEKYMPEGARWTHPEGGFFIFMELPGKCDTLAWYEAAIRRGIAYVPGSFFYPDGSHRNTMRLNFSYMAHEKIEPAIQLLAGIVKEMMA